MPKFTIEQIEAEIAKLEGSGFNAAISYLKRELKRRKNAGLMGGRKITNTTKRGQQVREAQARYRAKPKEIDILTKNHET